MSQITNSFDALARAAARCVPERRAAHLARIIPRGDTVAAVANDRDNRRRAGCGRPFLVMESVSNLLREPSGSGRNEAQHVDVTHAPVSRLSTA